MFGWFKRRPAPTPQIEAADLAQMLLDECVRKILVDAAKDRPLDPATTARYEAKTRLFQLAAVLMALKGEERRNPGFGAVREQIECVIFASSPDGGASLQADINKAAQSLNDGLLIPTMLGKESGIRWAHAWLDEIGIEEWKWNPATCCLIALNWVDYCIMINDTLRRINPVAPPRQ